jgi:hypothetical protein
MKTFTVKDFDGHELETFYTEQNARMYAVHTQTRAYTIQERVDHVNTMERFYPAPNIHSCDCCRPRPSQFELFQAGVPLGSL